MGSEMCIRDRMGPDKTTAGNKAAGDGAMVNRMTKIHRQAWTDDEHDVLRREYGRSSYAEIAVMLGRRVKGVKSHAKVLGITRTRIWSAADVEQLRSEYPNTDTAELAARLGRELQSVYQMAKKLGIGKSAEYRAKLRQIEADRLRASGVATRYRPGSVPANKGTKGVCGVHPNSRRTQFKKGQKAINHRPIGSERVNVEGYIEIKVAEPNKWDLKQRVVWREQVGEIPPSHVIAFRDGNPLNCVVENLECVSRADWMKRYMLHNYPEPVRQQIHILAGFTRKLNRYAKEQDRRSEKHVV